MIYYSVIYYNHIKVKGLSGARLEAEVLGKMGTFDLRDFEHSRASQLSGGNMRREREKERERERERDYL